MTFTQLLELDKQTTPAQADEPKAKSLTRQPHSSSQHAPAGRSKHDITTSQCHATMTPVMVRQLRKAVRQLGKEAATHRFTRDEKGWIADIVYTYGRQGFRTTENEIVRIGANWLLEDYRINGAQSVLHRVLKALKS